MTLAPWLLALAYRPFLDPLPVSAASWWLMLAPMALGVAMAYKAVRAPTFRAWIVQSLVMTMQIIIGITLTAVAGHIVVEWAAPALAGM